MKGPYAVRVSKCIYMYHVLYEIEEHKCTPLTLSNIIIICISVITQKYSTWLTTICFTIKRCVIRTICYDKASFIFKAKSGRIQWIVVFFQGPLCSVIVKHDVRVYTIWYKNCLHRCILKIITYRSNRV